MERKRASRLRRELEVEKDGTLLPFLLENVQGKSRNTVKNLLTRRQVLVDGQAVTRHDAPLTVGQVVTVLPQGQSAPQELPFPICYEDKDLLAIEKPAGLLSVASDRERERTAYQMVSDYLRAVRPAERIFVVHRLDKDTSGLLLFAKSEGVKNTLQERWEELAKVRGYLAVVEGRPREPEGVVRSWLRETETHLVYSCDEPGKYAKEAITEYQTVKAQGGYSLLELFLATGRKNQIRVHMKDIGCPVVGDKKYGSGKSPIGRLCLHAHRLSFVHPVTGELVELKSRKPRDFNRLFRE